MRKTKAVDFQIFLARLGIHRFFKGFNYFKWLEYPLVYNNLKIKANDKYLDIGSGKSIFPLFVSAVNKCCIHVTDDQSIISDSIDYYTNVIRKIQLISKAKEKFTISKPDEIGKLNFPDDYFDKISCISTLEHMQHDGDSIMMKEISRVLKKEGRAVITFPFNNGDYIEEGSSERIGCFQRKYNISAIQARIIGATGLKVKKVIYFGERNVNFGRLFMQCELFKASCWFLTIFSELFWRVCHSYCGPYRNFHEPELNKEGIGVACIILEKDKII